MGENSKIEWTDHTFSPWIGCTKVSPGCDHCYAETLATARLGVPWGPHAERRRTAASTWKQPLAWNRKAAAAGVRARVFCASLSDVFDNQVPEAWRWDLLELIYLTPHLDWLLLTKRPQNIAGALTGAWNHFAMNFFATRHRPDMSMWDWLDAWREGRPPPNVWLGTSVENQAEADRRIPELLAVPAKVRFLSCEPLLGPVDLSGWLPGDSGCVGCDDGEGWGKRCGRSDIPRDEQCPENRAVYTAVDGEFRDGTPAWIDNRRETVGWVIAGGESGPQARPMHPAWARGLRDQCAAAGVPFLMKQWGEWAPAPWKFARGADETDADYKSRSDALCATHALMHGGSHLHQMDHRAWSIERADECVDYASPLRRVGKKAAGRLLDGVEHNGYPTHA